MTVRITTTGRDSWQGTRPPQSEANRLQTYGPLLPMDVYVRKEDYQDDPTKCWRCVLGVFLIVGVVVWAVFQ